MKSSQYMALAQLAEALRACKAEGVCVTVPGRDYVVLEVLGDPDEAIDLSSDNVLGARSLDPLLTRYRHKEFSQCPYHLPA